MSVTAVGQGVLYVLLAHWSIVVAVVESQPQSEAVRLVNSNNVVQQTQDVTHLSKLTVNICIAQKIENENYRLVSCRMHDSFATTIASKMTCGGKPGLSPWLLILTLTLTLRVSRNTAPHAIGTCNV